MSLLSVVMPCRNAMPRLERALESVRQALAGTTYEIVVADGGSTDGTLELLRHHRDVRLLDGADSSLYEGLNKAIAAATGNYLLWLNADDVVLAGMAELVERARAAEADIATGDCEVVAGVEVLWRSEHEARRMDVASVLFGVPTINSRVFRSELLRGAGSFREDIGLAADREMLLRHLELAPHRLVLPGLVYRYEAHADSQTMGRSWASYAAVHDANVMLARTARAGTGDARTLAAFGAVSGLAAARAQVAAGKLGPGAARLANGLASHPDPRLWWRGLDLHRRYRGVGSGW